MEKNEVITLKQDNLEAYMSTPHLMVAYTANHCGACIKLKPFLYLLPPHIKVIIVDSEKYVKSNRFMPKGVSYYPTIAYFKNGYFQKEIPQLDIITGNLDIE